MVINVFWNNYVFCSGNFKVQCISFRWVKKNLQTSVRSIFYRQESVNLLIWSKKKSTKLRLKAIDKQKSFYILLIFFLYTIMKFTHTHWGGTYCNWQHWFGPKFKGISTGKWKTAVMKFFPILYILKEIELSISLW